MKFLSQILIIFLLSSCSILSDKHERKIDNEFKKCENNRQEKLINSHKPDTLSTYDNKNEIHQTFETFLIKKGYLKEITQKEYLKLFEQLNKNRIRENTIDEFVNEIGFASFFYFNRHGFIDCHYKLYKELDLIDKEHWIYKFGLKYNELEAKGNLEIFDNYLKEALFLIPKKKFKNIEYRKLFIDLIYNKIDNTKNEFEN
jgi:hypothetical protein